MTHIISAKSIAMAAVLAIVGFTRAQAIGPALPDTRPASLTTSQQNVVDARALICKNPNDPGGYNRLAAAFVNLARETGDSAYTTQARDAVDQALHLAPQDFESRRTEVLVLLARHEFGRAHALALALNKQVPDDVLIYGLLADADVALGKYDQAEKAVQWMLNLRSEDPAGLLRAADLREIFGDPEGAREMLDAVLNRTTNDPANRAARLARVGHLYLLMGKPIAAKALCEKSLATLPGCPDAIAVKAEILTAGHKDAEAADLLSQLLKQPKTHHRLYAWAEALERGGRDAEAAVAFSEFEQEARKHIHEADNANIELIRHDATRAHKPAEALQIANEELTRRGDVDMLDAYAQALHAVGRDTDAAVQIKLAMAVSANNPKLLFHAGQIALSLHDAKTALAYYNKAVECGATTEYYEQARAALHGLDTPH